jgi:hypothetical protein
LLAVKVQNFRSGLAAEKTWKEKERESTKKESKNRKKGKNENQHILTSSKAAP